VLHEIYENHRQSNSDQFCVKSQFLQNCDFPVNMAVSGPPVAATSGPLEFCSSVFQWSTGGINCHCWSTGGPTVLYHSGSSLAVHQWTSSVGPAVADHWWTTGSPTSFCQCHWWTAKKPMCKIWWSAVDNFGGPLVDHQPHACWVTSYFPDYQIVGYIYNFSTLNDH
jgi:hypothetical protein